MQAQNLRVAFAGTPEFAAAALKALIDAGYHIPLVFTQPDKPAGRGLKLSARPVKQLAQQHGIAVLQPKSLRLDGKFPDEARAAHEALRASKVDGMVVAAYGLILPQSFLDIPAHGCVNIHGSVLPRWRGAAPIHRAIEAGDVETGITLMQMDAGLDTGPMLVTERIAISLEDTTASLHDKLALLGARMVAQHLPAIVSGQIKPAAQPAQGVTYAEKIRKDEALINWADDAQQIARRIRAFDSFPGAVTVLDGSDLKIWGAMAVASPARGEPGTVMAVGKDHFIVACGSGLLQVSHVQRPGGKRQSVADWLRAQPLAAGARLG
ncbi:MAG: methionyl-tRNA formyltransferase [Burkholderiaceae bacterium]